MQKKLLISSYKRLIENLTQRPYLRKAQYSKKALIALLQELDFKGRLNHLSQARRYSPTEVLSLCMPAMERLCPDTPEEGWLSAIYDGIVERLFPSGKPLAPLAQIRAGLFYLVTLKTLMELERETLSPDPMTDFAFASGDEWENKEGQGDYTRFLRLLDNEFVLELMRIGREIKPFNTLSHVAGVHHVAMTVAKQLAMRGVAVDLGLVSAAAAAHDIGKFGCRGRDARRIPYLHYYYTEQWLKRHHFPVLAHVAANHSTWDLELENLPVESLLLIYADFRVKSSGSVNGKEQVGIYTLNESFDVILGKLDDVDEKKRRRYERVYHKLHDFEDYMVSLGVDTDPYGAGLPGEAARHDPALMSAQAAVQGLKFLAIAHNLSLMHKISADTSFVDLLEAARSEKSWKHLRTYVNIFEEYSSYMTQKQKLLTMRFLYELFMHKQGDIRRQAASLFANLLAHYDVEYRKELPPGVAAEAQEATSMSLWREYIELILYPDHKVAPKHRVWINNTLRVVLSAILDYCKQGDREGYLNAFLACFIPRNRALAALLLDAMQQSPIRLCEASALAVPLGFAADCACGKREEQAAALLFVIRVLGRRENAPETLALVRDILDKVENRQDAGIAFLLFKAYGLLPFEPERLKACEAVLKEVRTTELFLENLKTATPWVIKEVNIGLLLYRLREDDRPGAAFYVATHLTNLVRVSERISVRYGAGDALMEILPALTLEQCNEIAIELTKGLETAEYEFSKYIPQYLGRLVLELHPKELDELIDELEKYAKSANERAASVTMHTLGVMLTHYNESYRARFGETQTEFRARDLRLMGLLVGSLAHYNDTVRQEAFLVIGKQMFGGTMDEERKREIFEIVHKKLLTLISEQQQDALTFFNSASSLNHIYRFIINTDIKYGGFHFVPTQRIAFFPGTFDPFSASHKGIVQEIKRLGLTVYLALDEFSWSKRTQPHMVRRRILNMSVAGEFGVYLFPDDIPVNIANEADLRRLKSLFPGQDIYIVAGSDVILNASSYKNPPGLDTIHNFRHVVFRRNTQAKDWLQERAVIESRVRGEILELTLPIYLEDVSSTRIRDNIDHNRDISMLVDPVAQSYIYDNGLYLREPQYKLMLQPEDLRFSLFEAGRPGLIDRVMALAISTQEQRQAGEDGNRLALRLASMGKKPGAKAMAMFDGSRGAEPVGYCCFYPTSAARLNEEFSDLSTSEFVRRHTSGKIAVISGIYVRSDAGHYDVARLLLTETLAHCLKEDFTYALYPGTGGAQDGRLKGTLERQGFLRLDCSTPVLPVWAVDMRTPIALIEDIQLAIKAPLSENEWVAAVLAQAHRRVAMAMAGLYPGKLVISFHAGILNHALTERITIANGVAGIPPGARQLGKYMCVPYGKILKNVVVPNTVTKTLHAEKTYAPDLNSFDITEYPGYAPLIDQVRTIKSFNRPVLLADDILHKGYRMEALDPLFKNAGLDVERIVVGILSGRGKDLADMQGRKVDSVYFIPNLRYWFVESMLYPFLGGDSVRRSGEQEGYALPSITQILPYAYPSFISGTQAGSLYRLSMTCLENARDILAVLEREHQALFERNLTLNRLGEAMLYPRVQDQGGCLQYDGNLSPSVYVENDIERLKRMETLFV